MAKKKTKNTVITPLKTFIRSTTIKIGYKRVQAFIVAVMPPELTLPKTERWKEVSDAGLHLMLHEDD